MENCNNSQRVRKVSNNNEARVRGVGFFRPHQERVHQAGQTICENFIFPDNERNF